MVAGSPTGPLDPSPQVQQPWGWRELGLVVVIGTVLAVVLTMAGLAAYGAISFLEQHDVLPQHVIQDTLTSWGISNSAASLGASGVVVYGAFFLAVWLVLVRGAHVEWRALGLRPVSLLGLGTVIPVYIVILVISALVTQAESTVFLHGQLHNPQDAIFTGDTQRTIGQVVIYIVVISIIGPFVEELLFRGLLYRLLRRSIPLWAAVAISSLALCAGPRLPRADPASLCLWRGPGACVRVHAFALWLVLPPPFDQYRCRDRRSIHSLTCIFNEKTRPLLDHDDGLCHGSVLSS